MTPAANLQADGFHLQAYNQARPFSSFLPGIAGEYGKPLWLFYANRGQCVSSFGVRDRDGAMLEFQPANKAYVLTSLLGFRTFFRVTGDSGLTVYEPFASDPARGITQRLCVRPAEIEIEETNAALGLRIRVVYFTLPDETLPALVRQVTVENLGEQALLTDVLDGLPQIVPYGLAERPLKAMSRTMEAFAEILHVADGLPFFKLKVEPGDRPDVQRIDAGFFAFTLLDAEPGPLSVQVAVPVLADPDLVFGSDTGLRTPLPFARGERLDALAGRCETLTGCAFAQLPLVIEPGASASWTSYFGQAPNWEMAQALRLRIAADPAYAPRKRLHNNQRIAALGAQFALLAGPPELDPYTRQAFLDNTLRGGQPVVIEGPSGPRLFHAFTRKHGDMERDYNFFELAPTFWSQGNGNFRDINQNRRSENFSFAQVGTSNIETFFKLIQIDGYNPLVVESEKFQLSAAALATLAQTWPGSGTPAWQALLGAVFSPGQLFEALLAEGATPEAARPRFDQILGLADTVQGAVHGEGYWVDHWTYNLDLLDSYAALYPDRMRQLLIARHDFSYFDNDHVVQPRAKKTVRRADGTVRQLHAVVRDVGKTRLIASRTGLPQQMRMGHGHGAVYRSTLLAKIIGLVAVKATLFDPAGHGLEMEAEKPGWCDALNGLPGLFGSSTHEAYALRRWVAFARKAVQEHLGQAGALALALEVAALVQSLVHALQAADRQNFFPTWDRLADLREAFRDKVRLGVVGEERALSGAELLQFLALLESQLAAGLAASVDLNSGLPVSYYSYEVTAFEPLPLALRQSPGDEPPLVFVRVLSFAQRPLPAFLEGAVHALRGMDDVSQAQALHAAVRRSPLYDAPLGMYRVNAPLGTESFEIGRSKTFSPGWLENESIFLHMHYKFMLETLRSGLAQSFYDGLRQGLVAFHKPEVYGRSPLENSSFIASSRFSDTKVHGRGFVARLSGATAEWISMVLHMALGAAPFIQVAGSLRFAPKPLLADWLFTTQACDDFAPNSFGIRLFGLTWLVFENPRRGATFGEDAVVPVAFDLQGKDGSRSQHQGPWLPEPLALQLREGRLERLVIRLDRSH